MMKKKRITKKKIKKIISNFPSILTAAIAGWLTMRVFYTFGCYLKQLWHIEEMDYIYDKPTWMFRFEYFFMIFFFVLVVAIIIILLISKIHECEHKNKLHYDGHYDKLECAYHKKVETSSNHSQFIEI